MRLWHKDLIPVLPRQQLLGQWRECCYIAKSIAETGTPNHILVNKVMDYPLDHFYTYCEQICMEMKDRGYRFDFSKLEKYMPDGCVMVEHEKLFEDWHNERYLVQCLMNLQEKYDCGGLTDEEWVKVSSVIKEVSK